MRVGVEAVETRKVGALQGILDMKSIVSSELDTRRVREREYKEWVLLIRPGQCIVVQFSKVETLSEV